MTKHTIALRTVCLAIGAYLSAIVLQVPFSLIQVLPVLGLSLGLTTVDKEIENKLSCLLSKKEWARSTVLSAILMIGVGSFYQSMTSAIGNAWAYCISSFLVSFIAGYLIGHTYVVFFKKKRLNNDNN